MSIDESIANAVERLGPVLLALGLDASGVDSHIGVSLIAHNRDGTIWLAGGVGADLAYDLLTFAELVAIEQPQIRKREAAKYAMAAMEVAAELSGAAKGRGVEVLKIPAESWRGAVLGRSRRTSSETIDAICARVLPKLVNGLPRRTNSHVRDSCGVALCGARMRVVRRAI